MNDFITERNIRLNFLRSPDLLYKKHFEKNLLIIDEIDVKTMQKAMWFADTVDYHHPKLPSFVYLAHPYRVANMALREITFDRTNAVIAALLHNVLEVSNIDYDFLVENIGSFIAQGLLTLKVDRPRQWDPIYKANYYLAITQAPMFVGQIKVLDKLDNLFVLGLNPDDHIRQQYCDEIEKYLLPLAQIVLPALALYIKELLCETKILGHYEL